MTLITQKSHDVEDRDASLFVSLRNRSFQAFYSSLGLYNNPVQKYRVESFCILLANAWELLLKARIVELDGPSAIERNDGKTISLTKAVERLFASPKDPTRRNIERVNELRDKAVHLLIPDIQRTLSRIFQASVLNYLHCVDDYHYPNPYANQLPGLLSLVSDYEDMEESIIATKYGAGTVSRVHTFLTEITDEENRLGSSQFAIPLQYKLVLTKDEREGDLKLTPTKGGTSIRLVEVPKDHNKTHPHRQKDVIARVNSILRERNMDGQLSTYTFQGLLLKEKIRTSGETEYHHRIENPLTSTYSDRLVEFIVHKIETNPEYIKMCKEIWRTHLRDQKRTPDGT